MEDNDTKHQHQTSTNQKKELPKMTKSEYIKAIATRSNTSQIQTENVIKSFIDIVNTEEKIAVHGLGTFKHVVQPAAIRRNPVTGGSIQCPEKTVLRFKATKKAA